MEAVERLLASLPPGLELPVLGRLVLALVLGAAVGLERELSGKPAGLRTIVLIAVGAELLTEMSLRVATGFAPHDLIRADPARIAAQIVSGIGFIGAGTILVHRGSVVGLTTAATLWVAAAIGIAVGARAYVPAVGATLFVILTLVVLRWLEVHMLPDRGENILRVTLKGGDRSGEAPEELLRELGFRLVRLDVERKAAESTFGYRIVGRRSAREHLVRRLSAHEAVLRVKLE